MPLVGKPAPSFKTAAVVNGEIKQVALEDYAGKYVVLFFYPLDFTFVCPTEIVAFSEAAENFRAIGAEVLAVSVDSEFSHLAWTKVPRSEGGLGDMKIPLLADVTKKMARDYDVLIEDAGVALRGLFIISDTGIIRSAIVNDLPVGRNVDEALRLVKAFQFTDKHGEVCPAGWQEGKATMIPDPVKSLTFFAAEN